MTAATSGERATGDRKAGGDELTSFLAPVLQPNGDVLYQWFWECKDAVAACVKFEGDIRIRAALTAKDHQR